MRYDSCCLQAEHSCITMTVRAFVFLTFIRLCSFTVGWSQGKGRLEHA